MARRIPKDGFMTVDEVATLLHVDRKTVYIAIQEGQVPGVQRFGRIIRIYRPAVLEWAVKKKEPKRRSR